MSGGTGVPSGVVCPSGFPSGPVGVTTLPSGPFWGFPSGPLGTSSPPGVEGVVGSKNYQKW